MKSIKYLSRLSLFLLISYMVTSCDQADRGGVTLKPKTQIIPDLTTPIIQNNSTPRSEAILSKVAKCLELNPEDYLRPNQIARIRTWDCLAESPFQGWFISENREILSTNGQCLSLGSATENGIPVVAEQCNGDINQKWDLDENTSAIRNESAFHLCLDIVHENIRANGNPVELRPCHGKESQQWLSVSLRRKYMISATNPDLMINIEPRTEGAPLAATPIISGWLSAEWSLEPAGSHYRIRNYWRPDQFLHIENGHLQSGPAHHYWLSAQWTLARQQNNPTGTYLIRSAWKTDIYIGLDETNNLRAGKFPDLVDGSTQWKIVDVNP